MKYLIKTLSALVVATPFLFACGGESGFDTSLSSGTTTTSTGVVSQKGLVLLFSEASPELWDEDGVPGTQTTIDISVHISDRNNIKITGAHTINFRAEWGSFDSNSCVTSDGTCSVKWTSGDPSEAPSDYRIKFIAYTLGEEEFADSNGNGIFDDGDVFTTATNDMEEPYIDCNHTWSYESSVTTVSVDEIVDVEVEDPDNPGQMITVPTTVTIQYPLPADQIIDVQTVNGTHDTADGLWNGVGCQHSSLCSGTTLITIWNDGYMDGNGDTDNPSILTRSSFTCVN